MVKKLHTKVNRLLLVALLLVSAISWGQSIWTNLIDGTNPNTSNPFTTGDVKNANITVSGIGRGAGATGTNANNRYNASSWNTTVIDPTAYFEFTLTPNTGYKINLSSFVYTSQASASNPVTSCAVRTSLDSFTANVGTPTLTGTTISLSASTYQNLTSAITIRFYVWGNASTVTTSTFSINDFTFNGTVEAAVYPEVTTTTVSSVTSTGAMGGGNVTADNGLSVTHKGTVWNTSATPTIALTTKTDDGTGTGSFTSTLSSLTNNTLYYYRAYATNSSSATAYGTEYSFYTLALAPAAPTLSDPQQTSIKVAVNSNGNGSTVLYAIRVNGTQYVQADGTLGASPAYKTVANWGTTTITGLASGTNYTVDVTAQNTGGVDSAYGPSASLATNSAASPAITLVSSSLTFGSVCTNAYATGTIVFSGANLSNADITVSELSGYSYSITEAGTYTSSLTITGYNGTEITVYARFAPPSVTTYNGTISVAGTGANSTAQFTVSASGTGINTAVTTTTSSTTSGITEVSATVNATVTTGCTAVTTYGFEYATTTGFTIGTGTTVYSNNLASGSFSATLNGLQASTTYYYRSFVTDGTGTYNGAQQTLTTASLATPVATAATAVAQTSFTANWNAVSGADSYTIDVSTTPTFGTYDAGATATDLFISEYVEGTSNNKYIEIYNGTGATVSLTDYRLRLYANGGSTASNDVALTGTLANGATIVYRNTSANIYAGITTTNSAVNYNGDDAIVLYKISTASNVDIVGRIGEDPGVEWRVNGGFTTLDKTLRRKNTVTHGVTTNPASGFPTLATEWITLDINDVSNLGSHDFGFVASYVSGYENFPATGTSASITGVDDNTTFYYRVRAASTNDTSANSNTISLTTLSDTVTWVIPNGLTAPEWQPSGQTPTTLTHVVIAEDYNTATDGTFTAKSITLNNGYTFTLAENTTITLEEGITNNGEAADFVIENNASLLQNSTTANTAEITILKTSNPLYRLDYTMWSSPVTGLSLYDFSPATASTRFYEYIYFPTLGVEAYNPIPSSTEFVAGKGYLIRMPNILSGNVTGTTNDGITTPAEYVAGTDNYYYAGEFAGVPNNGTITQTLSLVNNRYNAVGNPYPSPISLYEFVTQNSSVLETGALYFWRKKNDTNVSSYATLTLSAFTANSGSASGGQDQSGYFSNPDETTWTLAPAQGFLVQTKVTATTGTELTFNNSMRKQASSAGQAFFKNVNPNAGINKSRYWLNLTNQEGGFSQMAVAYMENTTTGFDFGYDGKTLVDENNISLYTIAENNNLSVQARPEFENQDVVTAGYTAVQTGEYTISMDHNDGVFANGQSVFLVDKTEGVVRNLSEGSYTFTTEAGTFNNRFDIVYTATALGSENPVIDAGTVVVYKNGNTIDINTGNALMEGVTVYDIRGRKLFAQNNLSTTETTINNLTAQQQVLIVEVKTEKGTVSKKIVY